MKEYLKTAKYAIIAILIIEAMSFFVFNFKEFQNYVFALFAIFSVLLFLYKIEYGIYAVFAELCIGSLGKIIVFDAFGFDFTLRMFLWLCAITSFFILKLIKKENIKFFRSDFFIPYLFLGFTVSLGVIFGVFGGYHLKDVFLDVNNYAFFLLVLPSYEIFIVKKNLINLFFVLLAACGFVCAKTIFLFYVFSHELFYIQDKIYAWSRFSHLAEITNINPNALVSRIFMQSQIWILFLFFFFAAYIFKKTEHSAFFTKDKKIIFAFVAWSGFLSALIMSFSRSFWIALVITLFVMSVFLLIVFKNKIKTSFKILSYGLILLASSVVITMATSAFPIPKGSQSADLIKSRAKKFSGEAALSSRYSQIAPLVSAISEHPILGSGFGAKVTYKTQDPRILEKNPDGYYTTSSFELGWLEILLKTGLLGFSAYIYLIFSILKKLFIQIIKNNEGYKLIFALGAFFGIISLVITHAASPYLNHPLGIGIIIFSTIVSEQISQNSKIQKHQ